MSAFIDGSTASLRVTGWFRYLSVIFLAIWLIGWTIGEAVAAWFLFELTRSVIAEAFGLSWPVHAAEWIGGGTAGVAFLFLIVWLSLWTVGGIMAARELLRELAGEDRVEVTTGGLELTKRAGPLGRTRRFERSRLRGIRVRPHDHAVVVDTVSGSELITTYGSLEDRRALAAWLQQRLDLPADRPAIDPANAPPGWVMSVEGGAVRLNNMDRRTRSVGAAVCWVITGFTSLTFIGSLEEGSTVGSIIALSLTLLLASWAAWVTWSRREWVVRHGELTSFVRFWWWERQRTFKSARLRVDKNVDSDGDEHYKLNAIDGDGSKTISSEMNDDAAVRDFGRWLSSRTGFPLA